MKSSTALKDLLMQFMRDKNDIILQKTKLTLFDKEEYEEIDALPYSFFIQWAKQIINTNPSDLDLCPYCIQNASFAWNNEEVIRRTNCENCSFGKRYGRCGDNSTNLYHKIIERLYGSSIKYATLDIVTELRNKLITLLFEEITAGANNETE